MSEPKVKVEKAAPPPPAEDVQPETVGLYVSDTWTDSFTFYPDGADGEPIVVGSEPTQVDPGVVEPLIEAAVAQGLRIERVEN